MIALSLMGIIASVLFSYWRDLNMKNHQIEQVKVAFFKRETLQLRLSEIFSSLTEDLDVSEQELLFYYDNGIDPNPNFCSEIKGKLFFNKGTLYLESRSLINDEVRLEPLMTEIRDFRFEVFEVEDRPIHVRLIIEDIVFPFFLPKAHKEISL